MTGDNSENPALEGFVARLKYFHECCGRPPYRRLAETSARLAELYGERDLPALSAAAVSEVLGGRRKRFPSSAWVASFVLCCQRRAWEIGVIDEDPGVRTLPEWQAALQAARHALEPAGAAAARDAAAGPRGHRGAMVRDGMPGAARWAAGSLAEASGPSTG